MEDKFEYIYGQNVEKEFPRVSVSIERITPDVAAKMLETNVHNRKMPREAIAEALNAGEWELNGASIVFSDSGVLLDGQTRLSACVETGVSITSVIVRGLRMSSQLVMDNGSVRNIAHQLGVMGVKNAVRIGAIATAMYRKERWGLESAVSGSHTEMTIKAVVQYAMSNEARFQELNRTIDKVNRRYKSIKTGVIAVLVDEFEKVDNDCAREFLSQLAMDETPCQPVMRLVKKLDDDSAKTHGKFPSKTIAAFVVKAWNAYINGLEMSQGEMRFLAAGPRKEPFPEIATL